MKLLIVDDEELTRTGLITSVDWNSLGIYEVYQADDGIKGLELAQKYRPEIILCDVRMPRMDGITMLERLNDVLPNTVSIFMSGYSDKEYLKAAIKLKAVTYIEKPLNLHEVSEAVAEALERYRQNIRTLQADTIHIREAASRLALCLTSPYEPIQGTINGLLSELSLTDIASHYFCAFIIRTNTDLQSSAVDIYDYFQSFCDYLKQFQLNCLYTQKHHQYLVLYLYSQNRITPSVYQNVAEHIQQLFSSYENYYVIGGEICHSIQNAYQSYTSAVVLTQSSFFYPAGSILSPYTPDHDLTAVQPTEQFTGMIAKSAQDFQKALQTRSQQACTEFLDQLYQYFDRTHKLLPNQAKDVYYKLFSVLDDARNELQLPQSAQTKSLSSIMENCFSFHTLHNELYSRTTQYLTDIASSIQKNPIIFMIEEFIKQNFSNGLLSVKDISEHVSLSTSYLCTFFKNETGRTLNQYLTEQRMERAKQLLLDPRYKISEISAMVGYSDGNYFGKSFRKATGLSPSEYRERMSQ